MFQIFFQPEYPQEAIHFMKSHPHSKMNEGMETLRQIATTSLFLQSEKNNISNNLPSIQFEEGSKLKYLNKSYIIFKSAENQNSS